jgi:hypothetical protein
MNRIRVNGVDIVGGNSISIRNGVVSSIRISS